MDGITCQVTAENAVVNAAWNKDGTSNNQIQSIGLMVYQDSTSLDYVGKYDGTSPRWEGYPITAKVPTTAINAGIQGGATSAAIIDITTQVFMIAIHACILASSLSWDMKGLNRRL